MEYVLKAMHPRQMMTAQMLCKRTAIARANPLATKTRIKTNSSIFFIFDQPSLKKSLSLGH